ncbi:hypothetical protein Q1695_005128 [Nippostrongylus brasiliensis]|nr:hypothetical protein Q1695_005128 [Nippostrongylus brasiliensis]
MLRINLMLLSVFATGFALMCKMCDNYISCLNEVSEHCPPHTQCYTIRREGTITHKGCATNCASLAYAVADTHCHTCHHRDNCNDEPSIGQGVELGHNNGGHHHHIGEGVRPRRSAAAASLKARKKLSVEFILLITQRGMAAKTSASPTHSTTSSAEVAEQLGYHSARRVLTRSEHLCAAIAYAVGSGSVWLVPSLIVESGLAVVVQFFVCYVFAGVPVLYMEIALGQFTSSSPYRIYQMIAPAMSGVPAAIAFVLVLRCVINSVIISRFMGLSAVSASGVWSTSPIEQCSEYYSSCYNYRMSKRCMFKSPFDNNTDCRSFLNSVTATRSDFQKATPVVSFTQATYEELEDSGSVLPNVALLVPLVLTWTAVFLSATLGIRIIGKLSYVILAISVLAAVIILGVVPHVQYLTNSKNWFIIAAYAVTALNLSTGGMIKLAAARPFNLPIFRDVVIISVAVILIHGITVISFIALIEKYADDVLPYERADQRSTLLNLHGYLPIALVAEVIAEMPFGWALTSLHFAIAALIPLLVVITDMWVLQSMLVEKYITNYRRQPRICYIFVAIVALCLVGLAVALMFIMPGTFRMVVLLDRIIKTIILILGVIQLVAVAYIYGFRRFSVNIRTMVGGRGPLNFFWWFNWIVFSPLIKLACFAFAFVGAQGYVIWQCIITGLTLVWVPVEFLVKNYERWTYREPMHTMFYPRDDWGPLDPYDREEAKQMERAVRVR